MDGWPDIYVCNDFLHSDILYINNGNGTFSDKIHECMKHSSFSSMGNDVADFNNDGLPDIFTLDMLPEDNYRKKFIIPAASYDKFQLLLQKGYEPQYTRNALQLNNGNGTFSDIAFLSGVSSTTGVGHLCLQTMIMTVTKTWLLPMDFTGILATRILLIIRKTAMIRWAIQMWKGKRN